MQMQDGDSRLLLLLDLPLLTAELGFLACLLLCALLLPHSCLALEDNWLLLERSLPIYHPFVRNDWERCIGNNNCIRTYIDWYLLFMMTFAFTFGGSIHLRPLFI